MKKYILIITIILATAFTVIPQTTSEQITTRRNQGKIIKAAIAAVEDSLQAIITVNDAMPSGGTADTVLVSGCTTSSKVLFTWSSDPGDPVVTWATAGTDTVFIGNDSAVTGTPAYCLLVDNR